MGVVKLSPTGALSEAILMGGSGGENPEGPRIRSLSAREREVLALIGEALSNKKIADRLCITETTVRHHLTSIFAKLGVSDRLELLVYAHRHKLVPPPS